MLNNLLQAFNNSFALTFSIYLVLMVGVIAITTLLSRLCLVLKDKAHLSDGVVAGIVLGVITSLPELITCLTSIIAEKNGQMGIGDIIGSNSFDLFVMACCVFACIWIFIDKKVNKVNVSSLICTGIGTVFVFLAALLGENTEMGVFAHSTSPFVYHGFNWFSIPIFLSYCGAVYFMIRSNKHKEKGNKGEGLTELKEAKKSMFHKLDLWLIVVLVAVVAIVLISISVILTYSSSSLINYHWGMNKGFGGALLLGVVTSLPEIVACVNLCIHKEYNMTIDTMVGSTAFNLSILTIGNIALACLYNGQSRSDKHIMYEFDIDAITQLSIGLFIALICIVYLVLNTAKYKKRFNHKQQLAINISTLSLVVLAYITYIVLGFIFYKQII